VPIAAAGTRIVPMTGAHAEAVLEIYQAGIEEGNATFETRAPDWVASSIRSTSTPPPAARATPASFWMR
jgi:hypothetical protein